MVSATEVRVRTALYTPGRTLTAVAVWLLADLTLSKTPQQMGLRPDGDVIAIDTSNTYVRSERQLMEQLDYNLLFRWFVGLDVDDRVWVPTRLQIAQHWHANLSHLAANAFDIGS